MSDPTKVIYSSSFLSLVVLSLYGPGVVGATTQRSREYRTKEEMETRTTITIPGNKSLILLVISASAVIKPGSVCLVSCYVFHGVKPLHILVWKHSCENCMSSWSCLVVRNWWPGCSYFVFWVCASQPVEVSAD